MKAVLSMTLHVQNCFLLNVRLSEVVKTIL